MQAVGKMPLLAAGVVCLLFSSFSYFSSEAGAQDVLSGCIAHYGSEPFTYIALKADDGETYRIFADAELDRALRALYGARIELRGTLGVSEVDGKKYIEGVEFTRMDSK